jgi:hypothetical protein
MDAFADLVILTFVLVAIWFSSNGWISLGLLGVIMNSSVGVSRFVKIRFSVVDTTRIITEISQKKSAYE